MNRTTILLAALLAGCHAKQPADLIIRNATIYTVDSAFSTAQAMAITNGKITATGTDASILGAFMAKETIDAQGKFIYPGFIDAHTHFYRYGLGLQTANLTGTKSWEEILKQLKQFAATHKDGWLIGRGWDQNQWDIKEFPSNEKLNELFPHRPVLLIRIDGHAAIASQEALKLARIAKDEKLTGGIIEEKNGKLTGILIDNAVNLVTSKIPAASPAQVKQGLMQAQQNCFAAGLTTVDDCGLDYREILFMDSLHKSGELKMRVYAMLSDAKKNYDYIFSRGKIQTERLHVCAFKVYADGALGSRGACLLRPYTDKPGWSGFLLNNPAHFDSVAQLIYSKGFQMCTHAIGDSGNRTILNTYARQLKGKNDLRWRIEHAQVINENDFKLFGENSIIPSVQPTHATSDMYWAENRLGSKRMKGAYAYKQLLDENGWIALGTDFPVEDISPLKTFYAAVVRKDAKGWPLQGFQAGDALSRKEALRGMTIWAAKANFEENEKGSLEDEKLADFVILGDDLMTIATEKILAVKIMATYVNGERVYTR
jgi:predicted amidohydrolase YtcJ